MAKTRKRFDPLARMSQEGIVGYIEEETEYQVLEVLVEDILDSPFQTREEIAPDNDEEQAKFAQLVYSIKTRGVHPPIPVQRHPTLPGKYFLPAGGHGRRDAAREAGLDTIPIVVVEFSEEEVGLATAQENLARRELTTIEEGRLYRQLMDTFGWTQEELASRLGMKNRGRIKDCVALVEFAPDILAMVRRRRGNSGMRAAGYLHRLDDPRYRIAPEEARRLRAPIITGFLANERTTEGVRIDVETILATMQAQQAYTERTTSAPPAPTNIAALLQNDTGVKNEQRVTTPSHLVPSEVREARIHAPNEPPVPPKVNAQPAPTLPVPLSGTTEREGQVQEVFKRFQRYKRLLGDERPSGHEQEMLTKLANEIQVILDRT